MKKKIIAILLILIMSIGLIGCKEETKINKEIVNFTYNYGSGEGPYYAIEINKNDDKYIFKLTGHDKEIEDVEKEIKKEDIEKLSEIIDKNDIKEWNGFDESKEGIYDGYGFRLEIEYESGEKIKAHGYMEEPENYDEAHRDLTKFLLSLAS